MLRDTSSLVEQELGRRASARAKAEMQNQKDAEPGPRGDDPGPDGQAETVKAKKDKKEGKEKSENSKWQMTHMQLAESRI